MNRCVCIHAHFYQPPRENPWLEEVELQDSASPYHDWNERIAAECYGPNTASRILDAEDRIADIVNNYSRISFNFGPTLLSWMERHRPDLHEAIVEADRESRARFSGHGSALAQVYNHMIMPLASPWDKRTQVLWGLRDFERRFGREPEGMWLAETAVDLETLDILAAEGIRFTILAPRQARRVRRLRGSDWRDASGGRVDPKRPYRCRLPSGRAISLFFYDGPISQDVAFSGLLNDGAAFARRLAGAFANRDGPQLVHIATDGETYGHHHRKGDMALAYCLHHIEFEGLARLTVYGEYLERNPPNQEVEIFEGSSWSCVHGVQRWQADCGCNSGTKPGWHQRWRRPLRVALDWLRDAASPCWEREGSRLFRDPWKARDAYVDVILDREGESVRAFLSLHANRELTEEESVRALKLLELQRHAMLMYTSCGWFFDEVSGIETVQVMLYAARAIQLARHTCGVDLEPEFLVKLRQAPSNVPEIGNAATAYERYVRPATLDLLRVGSHYAIATLFEEWPEVVQVFAYTAQNEVYSREEAGRQRLAVGRAFVRSDVTREVSHVSFAVLHLGDHNVMGGVREYLGEEAFHAMSADVKEPFRRSDIPAVIRVIDQHFGDHTYSLWHLFRDEQRKVLDQIRYSTLEEVEASLRQIYQNNYPIMNFLKSLQSPVPKALRVAAEYTVGADLASLFRNDAMDVHRLEALVGEVGQWSLEIDWETLGFAASRWVSARVEAWAGDDPADLARLEAVDAVLAILRSAPIEFDLWRAQNAYVAVGRRLKGDMAEAAARRDEFAGRWLESFDRLGERLQVRVAP
ncbi:MAG: DUF3536 domain-containing protein [Deltaproteobacteria bacterium]|nr:DUF3536 domain-containing protein [Deltaproteobacteria bacterium]